MQVSARGYDPAVAWMTAIGAVHVLRAVRLAGSDADQLAARFGVREDATFEDRIPVTLMIDLWEAAIAESGRRDLAPLAATRADLLHRYFPTVSDAYRWQVIDDRHHTTLRAEPVGPPGGA